MTQLGAIAAGHELAAQAGAEVLSDGGNAVDAAAACAFVSCSCEPTLTGPGGAGFATIVTPDGTGHAFDFFASVPGIDRLVDAPGGPIPVDVLFGATTQTFHVGPQSCAVPGFVSGVLAVHERFGRLPRARVLEPGIRIAREGLVMGAQQAYCHQLLERILTRVEFGRSVFSPTGRFLGTDDHFAQPGLAGSFDLLAAEGADAFYRGDIAAEIVRWADDNGGLLSRADLERYRTIELPIVRAPYRGFEIFSVSPPSSGGVLVAWALQVLDRVRASAPSMASIDPDTPDGAALLVATMEAANAVRGAEFDTHLYGGGLVEWLLSDEQVELGARRLAERDGGSSHPSSTLGSTTHLSVIDSEGYAVAMTTSTGCGSGEFVGDTGIHLNNMLGEEDLVPVEHQLHPGDRLTSMMSPSVVMHEGRPVLATGSAGSNRIRSAVVQTFIRALESRHVAGRESSLQQRLRSAVEAPRIHPEPGMLHVEPGLDESVMERLEAEGWHLNRWPGTNLYFGGVNMVAVDSDGSFASAADPRRGGGAWVVAADGSLVRP